MRRGVVFARNNFGRSGLDSQTGVTVIEPPEPTSSDDATLAARGEIEAKPDRTRDEIGLAGQPEPRPQAWAVPLLVDPDGRIRDDHGVWHPVRSRREGRPIYRPLLTTSEQRVIRRAVLYPAVALFGFPLLTALLFALIDPNIAGQLLTLTVLGAVLVGIAAISAGLWVFWPQRRKHATARRRLSLGECGACGFPIEETGRREDHCLVCPECGAAWTMSRLLDPDGAIYGA